MYFEKGKQMKGACKTGVTRRCERVQIQTAISKFKFKHSNVTPGAVTAITTSCLVVYKWTTELYRHGATEDGVSGEND